MNVIAENTWNKVRSSLWFVPTLMAFGAVALSTAVIIIDSRLETAHSPSWNIVFAGGQDGARAMLSTIAGSMIGVTGVVFSITIVTLSLASGQFGPRLLRNFMYDKGNQIVLGTFIGTFIFALLGLRTLDPTQPAENAPRLTVIVAGLLALASLAVLIYFIHHIATKIQADTVIADVAGEFEEAIDTLFPEALGTGGTPGGADPADIIAEVEAHGRPVFAPKSGYLQGVDADALMQLAGEADVIVRLHHRPGRFIVQGDALAHVWGVGGVDEKIIDKVAKSHIVGSRRTGEQDVEYPANQLVEIAARALSPGVNDPFTAMACIDRLGAGITRLASRNIPSACRYDEAGRLRVILERATFEGIVRTCFDPIREYGSGSVGVTKALLGALQTVARVGSMDESHRRVIREQMARLMHDFRDAHSEDADRGEVEAHFRRAIDAVA